MDKATFGLAIAGQLIVFGGLIWHLAARLSELKVKLDMVSSTMNELAEREQKRDERIAQHIEDANRHMDPRIWEQWDNRLRRLEATAEKILDRLPPKN